MSGLETPTKALVVMPSATDVYPDDIDGVENEDLLEALCVISDSGGEDASCATTATNASSLPVHLKPSSLTTSPLPTLPDDVTRMKSVEVGESTDTLLEETGQLVVEMEESGAPFKISKRRQQLHYSKCCNTGTCIVFYLGIRADTENPIPVFTAGEVRGKRYIEAEPKTYSWCFKTIQSFAR
ncbi:hypothetical protein HDU96_003323 [Phlyctochytrium bullatum]|nr:hypothetical protein HDU96_003323 [Phlyctochytrium bullatum]